MYKWAGMTILWKPTKSWAPQIKQAVGGEWSRPLCSRPQVGSSKGPKQSQVTLFSFLLSDLVQSHIPSLDLFSTFLLAFKRICLHPLEWHQPLGVTFTSHPNFGGTWQPFSSLISGWERGNLWYDLVLHTATTGIAATALGSYCCLAISFWKRISIFFMPCDRE